MIETPEQEVASVNEPKRTGLNSLCALARFHQIAADPQTLSHQLGLSDHQSATATDLLLAAKHLGLKAKWATVRPDRLAHTPLPALAWLGDAEHGRSLVLAQSDGQRVLIQDFESNDPSAPDQAGARPQVLTLDEFVGLGWSGQLMLVTSRASTIGSLAKFDFSWFIPAIVKHRKLLGEVLFISFMLQLFGLVSPFFFQVVMDKVLVHKGMTTLDVLVIGLVVVVVFESVLSMLRTYVLTHTTSRMDVELGAKLFRHLMQLPLAYFQARRVGDSVARVRELENIRGFLTGNAMMVVLDIVFSVVFIAVMFVYSPTLTLIALISLPLYAGLTIAVVPVLRRRLDEKFERGAENQAMLVETVTGIQTVKAGALEPSFAKRWDQQLAGYVVASFKVQNLASLANESIGLIGKLINAALLWWGAHLVMDGQLSVGQFIAFNMFAQRVSQPIMRMAHLWTDFQQTGISMARLGDILNTRTEVSTEHSGGSAQLPRLQGSIVFDQVTFRYRPEASPVLHSLSLSIKPGEVLGIVGRSGSGKSTLTKLVQRLYVPEAGRVLIDGVDISLIDAAQLRRQVGVVLQENLLFNRSIRENIAIADPAAPLEQVIHAAQMAGAHDFIGELSEGYNTIVGEQGGGLSGGQRQRVAIARALFTNPRILILDEATSALDYESEAIIQRNMAEICRGRTVLIIAHRLSAVRDANRIIVMDKGKIVEMGSHAELVGLQQGLYAYLWKMQGQGPQESGVVK